MKSSILIASGLLLAATPALAQEAAPAPPPAAEAPPAATTFTDAQVEGFARAALALRALNDEAQEAGELQADRQERVQQILADTGMDIATFNALGQAVRTDTALQARVQAALMAQSAAAAG